MKQERCFVSVKMFEAVSTKKRIKWPRFIGAFLIYAGIRNYLHTLCNSLMVYHIVKEFVTFEEQGAEKLLLASLLPPKLKLVYGKLRSSWHFDNDRYRIDDL